MKECHTYEQCVASIRTRLTQGPMCEYTVYRRHGKFYAFPSNEKPEPDMRFLCKVHPKIVLYNSVSVKEVVELFARKVGNKNV